MLNTYVAEYVSEINGKSVITLDKKCSIDDLRAKHIIVDKIKLGYSLSHSENIIIVDTPDFNLKGKIVVFEQ